ncbi:hypothetical protein KUTeg_019486 [Tegillarca granosa]|uniref:Uncharacterized protein n=1 Tax=Tegillarca granosa TaxID=220873 RepID=A0ABQ9EI47_TEGGR|nr:hypothetical protein KUTeg_019486 [Tegillarca granosa]
MYRLIDESPRWLLSKGKNEKAFKIIRKMSKMNKVPFSVESQELMVSPSTKFTTTFLILIRNRELAVRVVILMLSW